jgi:hypothetical protein
MDAIQLLQCLECAAQQALARAMSWTQGSYVWESALPKVPMPLLVKDNWSLFLSAARILPEHFLRQRLEAVWAQPWKQGPCASHAKTLPWQAAELRAVHRLKLCKTPAQAVQHAGEEKLYARIGFVLWQADMWKPSCSPQAEVALKTARAKPAAHEAAKLFEMPVQTTATNPATKLSGMPAQAVAVEEEWEGRLLETQKAWEGRDAFSILGVERGADAKEIKRAYFVLVRQFHPDKLPPEVSESTRRVAAHVFAQLGEAYRCLSDEEGRKALLSELGGDKQVEAEALFAAEDLFRKASRMVSSRRFAEALPLLEEALRLNPKAAECWAFLGYAKRFIPEYGEKAALRDLEKAKQQNPALPDTCYFLGRLAKLRKEAPLAKKFFEECLSLAPGHLQAQQELRLLKF